MDKKILLDSGELLNSIKYPLITEKAINLYSKNQYTFIVDRILSKTQIRFILEKIFSIQILSVNVCNLPVRWKRVGRSIGKKTRYKKAFITLEKGKTISELIN